MKCYHCGEETETRHPGCDDACFRGHRPTPISSRAARAAGQEIVDAERTYPEANE